MELDAADQFMAKVDGDCSAVEINELWADPVDDGKRYWDDISGKVLDSELVKEARAAEIKEAVRMGVWETVPRARCFSETGKPPVGTRWVDVNKGDDSQPKVRSRLVAQEIKRDSDYELFVATPPIEYIKYLVSRTASTQRTDSPTCLMVQDVKKAFFYAPSTRPMFVSLPPEALSSEDGDCCGMLKKSLYGTRDAALNWSLEYTRVILLLGFVKGSSSPCTFSIQLGTSRWQYTETISFQGECSGTWSG